MSELKEYNILPVVYTPEFAADNNEVNITALITDAAKAMPTLSNTIVNGLWLIELLALNNDGSVYGIIAPMTAIDNT